MALTTAVELGAGGAWALAHSKCVFTHVCVCVYTYIYIYTYAYDINIDYHRYMSYAECIIYTCNGYTVSMEHSDDQNGS